MELSLSQFPVSPFFSSSRKPNHPNISSRIKPLPIYTTKSINYPTIRGKQFAIINAIEEPKSSSVSSEESESEISSTQQKEDELSELGSEIKKALKERERKGSENFWSGVGEEIGQIEWPPFNKVLGTTGVVLGVIAGSSIVLLTVNAVLAELSDQVFAGRGFQDFFSLG